MSTVEHQPAVTTPPTASIPPLRDGDRLSRDEFERRYEAMPHVKKAELIEGVVYMPSPVRFQRHGLPHFVLGGWIAYYAANTPGLEGGDNATNRLSARNEPQPDLMLLVPNYAGGATFVDEDDYVNGPPELICEVSASTKSTDLGRKKAAYSRNGVKEYLVWCVEDGVIHWFVLDDGQYQPIPANEDGLLCSTVFPGLWLDAEALMEGNLAKVFAAVDRGTATDAHGEFMRRLAGAKPANE